MRPDERKRLGAGQSAHLRGDARPAHPCHRRCQHRPAHAEVRLHRELDVEAGRRVGVALLQGREPPASPVYFNTCYSHVGDEYGISVVGVFRPSDNGFTETPNSGGVSPRGAAGGAARAATARGALRRRLVRLDREGRLRLRIGVGGLLRCGFSCGGRQTTG